MHILANSAYWKPNDTLLYVVLADVAPPKSSAILAVNNPTTSLLLHPLHLLEYSEPSKRKYHKVT